MLHVNVTLVSGRSEKLSLPQSSKVGDLRTGFPADFVHRVEIRWSSSSIPLDWVIISGSTTSIMIWDRIDAILVYV